MKNLLKNTLWLLLLLPVAAFSQSPQGEWTMQVPDENGNMMTLKLSIGKDAYTVDFGMDGTLEVKGNYTVNGDEMNIEDVEGSQACIGTKAVYKFAVTDESMTMTRVKDDCEGRGGPEGKMVFSRAK